MLIVSCEDSLAHTLRPRLDAANADVSRIKAYDYSRGGIPSLETDLDLIEADARSIGAALIIIDPLMAVLGSADAHKDQDIRRVLAQVTALAARVGATVLVVRHLNKANVGSAIYRGGGSIGILAAARVGLLLANEPGKASAEGLRILVPTKSNLGRMPPALAFELVTEADVARIEWRGTTEHTADDLLLAAQPTSEEDRTALDQAREWLRSVLADGPLSAVDVKAAAKEAGVSIATVRRAKVGLVQIQKIASAIGEKPRSRWQLAQTPGHTKC